LVVNARLERERVRGIGGYGFYPAYGLDVAAAEHDPLVTVERDKGTDGKWLLVVRSWKNTSMIERWPLPASFDPFVMQQFRFRKQNGRLSIHWEATPLCELDTTTEATAIGLYADRATVAYDMVRLTALSHSSLSSYD
jgi:hypothetical protein